MERARCVRPNSENWGIRLRKFGRTVDPLIYASVALAGLPPVFEGNRSRVPLPPPTPAAQQATRPVLFLRSRRYGVARFPTSRTTELLAPLAPPPTAYLRCSPERRMIHRYGEGVFAVHLAVSLLVGAIRRIRNDRGDPIWGTRRWRARIGGVLVDRIRGRNPPRRGNPPMESTG